MNKTGLRSNLKPYFFPYNIAEFDEMINEASTMGTEKPIELFTSNIDNTASVSVTEDPGFFQLIERNEIYNNITSMITKLEDRST